MSFAQTTKKLCIVIHATTSGDEGQVTLTGADVALPGPREDCSTDVLILWSPDLPPGEKQKISSRFRQQGISAKFVDPSRYAGFDPARNHRAKSLALFRYLEEECDYDVIHFLGPIWPAFYTLCARSQGTAFAETVVVLQPTELTSWRIAVVEGLPSESADLMVSYMEKEAVSRADYLIAPGRYALSWMQSAGWSLPENGRSQVALPVFDEPDISAEQHLQPIDELIFVLPDGLAGRPKVLIDTLNCLAPELRDRGVRVSLLGQFATATYFHSGVALAEGAVGWDFPLAIIPTDAAAPLEARLDVAQNAVVILPDPQPFSTNTVQRAAIRGVPVVVSDQDGAQEIPALVCKMTGEHLSDLILGLLERGVPRPRPMPMPLSDKMRAQLRPFYHEATGRYPAIEANDQDSPLVTVCITHYRRIGKLKDALRSIFAQTYPNVEIIVVDDGSPDAGIQAELDLIQTDLEERGGKLVRRENGYLGAARNTGAASAQGSYICFLDDDDLALPSMIENLVKAARSSGAEIVSGLQAPMLANRRNEAIPNAAAYPGKIEFFPLGGPLALTLNDYCLANASSLIRLDAFRTLGGYSELRNVGGEDHEFYTRALQEGMRIEISPHTAYLYETSASSMWGANSQAQHMARVLNAIEFDHQIAQWRDMAALIAGQNARERTIATRKWATVKSDFRETLQHLYDAPDLATQLQQLVNYAFLIGNRRIARAFSSALASARDGTEPTHSEPALGPKRGDSELPDELWDLLEMLLNYASSPELMRYSLFDEMRVRFAQDLSDSDCRALLKEIGIFRAAEFKAPLVEEIMFDLALRGDDYDTATELVDQATSADETTYLQKYADVSKAVEIGSLSNGLWHYLNWGSKEGREGYARLARLCTIAEQSFRRDIPLDRLRKTLFRLSQNRSRSDPGDPLQQVHHADEAN